VSADGRVVVGRSNSASGTTGTGGCCEAFRWTALGGMVGLGDLPGSGFESFAFGVSGDGAIVVGRGHIGVTLGFRWQAGVLAALPELPGGGVGGAHAAAVSGDGSTAVGYDFAANGREAFRIVGAGAAQGLGDLPGGEVESQAFAVSADGSVVVGHGYSAGGQEAFRWAGGTMQPLGDLPGGMFRSEAFGVSADGSVVVGRSSSADGLEAFRWAAAGGMVGLGDLPGGAFLSEANAVSADGKTIVGQGTAMGGEEAVIWTPAAGIRSLRLVAAQAGLNLGGWWLEDARGVSANGRVIVGIGTNPAGATEGFVLDLGCYADCNGSGSLTVADFGCFQSAFVAGDPDADCDGSGTLTVADFGCFQTEFVAGCP
jgi:probable HAF family extracellular repeat protein